MMNSLDVVGGMAFGLGVLFFFLFLSQNKEEEKRKIRYVTKIFIPVSLLIFPGARYVDHLPGVSLIALFLGVYITILYGISYKSIWGGGEKN